MERIIDINAEIEHIKHWIREYFLHNGPDSNAIIGISGGKDSTVAAKLLVDALGADRVIGVRMPQGHQEDIDDAREICDWLGIKSYEINIFDACKNLYDEFEWIPELCINKQITTNTPARVRMTVLYMVAAACSGRVVNTCNASEDYVGYSTKFGDAAGDFSILGDYYVKEVIQIGLALGIPEKWVTKIPADGMCGKSDEDNLGFTYEQLDKYLIDGMPLPYEIETKIEHMHEYSRHKYRSMPICKRKPQIPTTTFHF